MRNPYIIGAYVTGRDHYGREELIDTLLEGGARAHWIVGNRRVGKTVGQRPRWKKAYVTLAEGQRIDFFESV